MKGMSVSVRKIVLCDEQGVLRGEQYYHPDKPTPKVYVHPVTGKPLTVAEDVLQHGVIVSEPLVIDDGVCVVVKMTSDTDHHVFETFWVGHLG